LAGSAASMRPRSQRASAGAVPPVEIATRTGARSTMAGMWKSDSAGRSTTLTGTRAARASAAAAASIRASPVATMTSTAPVSSAGVGWRRLSTSRPAAASSRIAGLGRSANSVTRAPASSSSRAFESAAVPPPTTAAGRPSSAKKAGNSLEGRATSEVMGRLER